MDETPSDSGALPDSPADDVEVEPSATDVPASSEAAVASSAGAGMRLPTVQDLREQIRRPAVWTLLLLIVVVLAVQIWLLYL